MGFYCPKCRNQSSLVIEARVELPYDARSDEISIQLIKCTVCEFEGVAVYEESRRGALDDDSYDHRGYEFPSAEVKRLKKLIASCPNPKNPKCGCPSHRELGKRNQNGYWLRLEGFSPGNGFNMVLG